MAEEGRSNETLDLLVVGAGPCGIAVGVAAAKRGLTCRIVDRGAVTQAMLEHPTYTVYFSGPEKLEVGGIPFTTAGDKPTRRETVRYYRRVVSFFDLDVLQYHEVVDIDRAGDGFQVKLQGRHGHSDLVSAHNVVIATGYYDNPRLLDAPGSDLPKVSYYFTEPFPYFDQDLLVIGGGNSAADAALTCWREGARVTLVHLFDELDKGVKPWVRPDIDNRIAEGSIPAYWRHKVTEIDHRSVVVRSLDTGEETRLENDWILAMIGYVPAPGLLADIGVTIDPETGIPTHDPETMLTDQPGVYIAGVLAAGYDANKIFIENGKLHGDQIVNAILAGIK